MLGARRNVVSEHEDLLAQLNHILEALAGPVRDLLDRERLRTTHEIRVLLPLQVVHERVQILGRLVVWTIVLEPPGQVDVQVVDVDVGGELALALASAGGLVRLATTALHLKQIKSEKFKL